MARPLAPALALAVGLHAGLLMAMSHTLPSAGPQPPASELPPLEVSILVEAPLPQAEASSPPSGASEPAAETTAPPTGPALAPAQAPPRRRPGDGAPVADADPPDAPPTAPSATVSPFADEGTTEARGRQAIAGLMQGSPWLLGPGGPAAEGQPSRPAGPAGIRREDPDRGGKLLREGMAQADVARGLGVGGPVASAAHSAALTSGAPVEGAATFEVVTDASGTIVGVRVSGQRGGDWSRVAAALQASLAGRKLRVPAGAAGVAVVVRIEAKHQLPSGRAADAKPVEITGVSPVGVAGRFDLADASGQVSRVVSARIVAERSL